MLGSELWEDNLSSMLDLFMEYVVDVWKLRLGCMRKISVFHSPCLRSHLGNWGDVGECGRLRSHSSKIVVKHSQRAKSMERAHYRPLEFQKKKTMQ